MPKNAAWPSETWPAYPLATFQAAESAPHRRIRIRLSRKNASWTNRGASAARPKKTTAPRCRASRARTSGAQRLGAALAEESGRPEDQHGDEQQEVQDFFPGCAEEVGADDFH